MSDLTDFLEARMLELEEGQPFPVDRIVATRGLINLHSVPGHSCPGRDYDGHRIPDYEQDCPTMMLLAHPYRFHPDWRGEWKA